MAKHSRCTPGGSGVSVPPCRVCPIVGPQIWNGAEQLADRLEAARVVEHRPRGAWLYRQGEAADRLFALIEGAVVISRDDGRGEAVAVHLATPGTTLGFRGVLEGGRHTVSAQCASRSLVCSFPVDMAEEAMAAIRPLEGVFFHHLADELSIIQDRMLRMATLGVRDRLVLLLGQMAGPFGRPVTDGALLIATPVSRMDMGALAGMTPETVSRCIRTLEAENLAHFTRRHILIPDHGRFRAELARLGHGELAP
ncbi:MAG: Crp/Fnr family transcriptional regulator [Bacteroidales bacterium]